MGFDFRAASTNAAASKGAGRHPLGGATQVDSPAPPLSRAPAGTARLAENVASVAAAAVSAKGCCRREPSSVWRRRAVESVNTAGDHAGPCGQRHVATAPTRILAENVARSSTAPRAVVDAGAATDAADAQLRLLLNAKGLLFGALLDGSRCVGFLTAFASIEILFLCFSCSCTRVVVSGAFLTVYFGPASTLHTCQSSCQLGE